MKKAFTLIELVTAVAILAVVLSFAGVVFKVSINSHRFTNANDEIMQKLRAITSQLNADFESVLWDLPGRVVFNLDSSKINNQTEQVRSDNIVFFAIGDFESIKQYAAGSTDKTVRGNTAAVFYCLESDYADDDPKEKILIRRQTIFTCNPDFPNETLADPNEYYNIKPFAELVADSRSSADGNTPELADLRKMSNLDPDNKDDFKRLSVMYVAKGVDDLTIQYIGMENPQSSKKFYEWRPEDDEASGWPRRLSPTAFKFTFTIYDSKGIIKDGKTFTYIVHLNR